MTNYLRDWVCANCDEWQDNACASTLLRNGQRICLSCYRHKCAHQQQRLGRRFAKFCNGEQQPLTPSIQFRPVN